MRKLIILGAIFGLIALASPVQAVPLAPGGLTAGVPNAIPAGSTTLATAGGIGTAAYTLKNVSGMTVGTGTWASAVMRDGVTGNLDFVYQVSVKTGDVGRISVSSFAGFTTDVGFTNQSSSIPPNMVSVAGQIPPTTVSRSTVAADGGATVSFDFTAITVGPGTTSSILVIKTNATLFSPGSMGILDQGIANEMAFQPATVPEPASLILMATGVLGLGGYAWRRRKLLPV